MHPFFTMGRTVITVVVHDETSVVGMRGINCFDLIEA